MSSKFKRIDQSGAQENAKSFHYSTLLKILWVVDLLTISFFKEQRVLEEKEYLASVIFYIMT